jgi:hypothetical protein
MADRYVPPRLSAFEIRGTEDIAKYSEALREISRTMAAELDYTAAELQVVLSHAGLSLSDKFQARMKARKVTRRLRRARDLYHGAALEAVAFWATYRQEYDPLIVPSRQAARAWKWEA